MINIVADCLDTYNNNVYLSDILDVKVIHSSDTTIQGIHIPKGTTIDAMVLAKLCNNQTDVYGYTIAYPKIKHSQVYKPKFHRSVGSGRFFEYSDKPLGTVLKHIFKYRFQIQIINQCNRTCKWCPPYHRKAAPVDRMSKEVLDKVLDIIESRGVENTTLQISRISEPTWDPEFLLETSKYIKNRFPDLRLSIITNGDWIRDNTVDECNRILKYIDSVMMNEYDGDGKTGDILSEFGDSRGGTRKGLTERPEPHCWEHMTKGSIEVNGDVMACCRTTKLDPKHSGFVVGNIMSTSTWDEFEKLQYSWSMIDACKQCTDTVRQTLKIRYPTGQYTYPELRKLGVGYDDKISIINVG